MIRRGRFLLPIAFALSIARSQTPSDAKSAFEVASIRITPKAQFGYMSFGPSGSNVYTATNITLEALIQVAYDIPYDRISGREKLGTEHYNVAAKAEDGVLLTYEQLQPRLQRLLAERFKLSVHRETKIFDGYTLVVAKGGPKLKPSTASSEQGGTIYPGGLRLPNMTIASFAGALRSPAGRPVIDKTGIAGNFDFELAYARDDDLDSSLPSFFTALQQEYGLRLEPAKIPLELLVIDGVEKIPTEN